MTFDKYFLFEFDTFTQNLPNYDDLQATVIPMRTLFIWPKNNNFQGEQLCKQGKWTDAIDLFKRALELGTNDPEIRTAVYSQVGNAYFYLKDYNAARGKF